MVHGLACCEVDCGWLVVFTVCHLHDGTLGEGEVLHQNVQASVLIVEELTNPPAT